MKTVLSFLVVLLFGAVFASIVGGYAERDSVSALAEQYLAMVPRELGAPNVVTGILITYRGFDTLGEVAVLFMVAAGVGVLLGGKDTATAAEPGMRSRRPSELVGNGAEIILPLIFLFGAYVIKNGHLSAGGGFQGGAVVASGTMLLMLALPSTRLNHGFLGVTESLAGVVYVGIGILGLVFAAGFLDSHILPSGEFGTLVSAGAIPVISALLGVKVGAELSVIVDRFRN
ncbi:multicomponent Na+:H+ antiporter subunit B [Aminobacter aminovorans]|uniref:Putative monovalent cation/H+ antiporter subunit B n=1 Tax=Aminobacter aminovorans TaxID=83263 RepID=A0A381IMA8_AMIAI|nr:hydrogen gas-evolving membrane-bound hydrogenase subunit E [Aminobacter aminovorans]TCS24979.1 multicomponent Na+:H+ antiporter subunit B [Aminobacter aminovorans]SUY28619.1 putative monovalent cation/H+ antiporter subunit B [Aminobacter aminovorans]